MDAGPVGDGAAPDASMTTDAGGFDPDGSYAGEGDECTFSIECAELQICVDDACVRHERVAPDALELGDVRWLVDEEVKRSPLYERADEAWETFGGFAYMTDWVFPGTATDQLLFTFWGDRFDNCQLGVLSDAFRVVHLESFWCQAAAISQEGVIAAVGLDWDTGQPTLITVAATGDEVSRRALPPTVHEALQEVTHGGAAAVMGTSVLFTDDGVLASFRVGVLEDGNFLLRTEYPYTDGICFVRFPEDGPATLIEVGGSRILQRDRGWLVHGEDDTYAVLLGDPGGSSPESPLDLVALSDGSGSSIVTEAGSWARYYQLDPTRFLVQAGHSPWCMSTLWLSGEDSWAIPELPSQCDVPEESRPGMYWDYPIRNGDLPATVYSAWLDRGELLAVQLTADGFQLVDRHGGLVTTFAIRERTGDGFSFPARPAIGAVSRFSKTAEGYFGGFGSGSPFDWFEFALRRR